MRILRPQVDASLFRHGGDFPHDAGLVDFSISVNPLGPPPAVLQDLSDPHAYLLNYPEPQAKQFCQCAAERHRVAPAQVLAGNGSNELIYLVASALRPRRVAIVEPTYTEYLRASLLAGADVDHWLCDADSFQWQPFDPGSSEMVWLCNPNNPTGQVHPGRALRSWIADFPRKWFVVDEAFMPFVKDEPAHSLVSDTSDLPNLVVLRSMTKFYCLPGLRLGYAVGHSALIARLREFAIPWSVNALAQKVGPTALREADYAEQARQYCEDERKWLFTQLQRFKDLTPIPSAANFILVQMQPSIGANELAKRLRESRICIRTANNFVGLDNRYFRVAVRTRDENERLLSELGRCLS